MAECGTHRAPALPGHPITTVAHCSNKDPSSSAGHRPHKDSHAAGCSLPVCLHPSPPWVQSLRSRPLERRPRTSRQHKRRVHLWPAGATRSLARGNKRHQNPLQTPLESRRPGAAATLLLRHATHAAHARLGHEAVREPPVDTALAGSDRHLGLGGLGVRGGAGGRLRRRRQHAAGQLHTSTPHRQMHSRHVRTPERLRR